MERGEGVKGMIGCCKTRKGLEENLGWPPGPATLPHHVCEAPFRPPQGLTGNPAPLATSEVGKGHRPSQRPRGREPCRLGAYLRFGKNGFPRRRQGSEDLGVS